MHAGVHIRCHKPYVAEAVCHSCKAFAAAVVVNYHHYQCIIVCQWLSLGADICAEEYMALCPKHMIVLSFLIALPGPPYSIMTWGDLQGSETPQCSVTIYMITMPGRRWHLRQYLQYIWSQWLEKNVFTSAPIAF